MGVAIQLSFNPGTKAVCSESPDRTELRDTHEALFPNQSVFWSKHLSDGNVNLLMCLLVSFPLYSSCCGHLSELRVTLVSEAEQTSGLTWCAASETVISSSFWETDVGLVKVRVDLQLFPKKFEMILSIIDFCLMC